MPSLLTILKGALLALPTATLAAGELGFALGFATGETQWGDVTKCKSTEQFVSDLQLLKKETTARTIRLYTTTDCNVTERIFPALKQEGFKVVLGLWSKPDDHFQKEAKELEKHLVKYEEQILGITVGSEALYREEETGPSLTKKIKQIQESVKKAGVEIPVGFADSWNLLQDGTANDCIEASDIILANAFSYWQGQEIGNATATFFDDIMQALSKVQEIKKTQDVNFWVGETNWPTGGKNFDDAVPSTKSAATYWKESICGMTAWGVNTFVFEAFDEPWKKTEKNNDVEKYWGVFDVDGKKKFDLTC